MGFDARLGPITLSAHDASQLSVQLLVVWGLRRWVAGSAAGGFFDRAHDLLSAFAISLAKHRVAALAVAVALSGVAAVGAAMYPRPGLTARYFDNPDFTGDAFLTVRDRAPSLNRTTGPFFRTNYGIEWTGVLLLAKPGEYHFALESDDGSTLEVDGEVVVDNGGRHSAIRADGVRVLTAGLHPIRLRYVQGDGGAALTAVWSASGVEGVPAEERPLATATTFPTAPSARQMVVFHLVSMVSAVAIWSALASGAFLALGLWDGISRGRVSLARAATAKCWTAASKMRIRPKRLAVAGCLVVAIAAGVVWIDGLGRGLTGRYYSSPDWTGDPVGTYRDRSFGRHRLVYDLAEDDGLTSVAWTGVVHLPHAGDYRFAVHTLTPSRVWIDGALIVNHAGGPMRSPEGVIRETPGFHLIRVDYAFDRDLQDEVRVYWAYGEDPLVRLEASDVFATLPDRTPVGRAMRISAQVLDQLWAGMRAASAIGVVLLAVGLILAEVSTWHARRLGGSGLLSVPAASLEVLVHRGLLLAMAVVYVAGAAWRSTSWWGFSKLGTVEGLRSQGGIVVAAASITALWLAVRRGWIRPLAVLAGIGRRFEDRSAWVAVVSLGAALAFFALRTGFLNSDAVSFRWATPEVIAGQYAPSIDEMLEREVHAWFWHLLSPTFGWSVRTSYQAASAIAGGLFVFVAWRYARRLAPGSPVVFVALLPRVASCSCSSATWSTTRSSRCCCLCTTTCPHGTCRDGAV